MTSKQRRKFAGLLVLDVVGRLLLLAVAVGVSLGMVALWVSNPPVSFALIPASMCVLVAVAMVMVCIGAIFVRPMSLKYLDRPSIRGTKNAYLK